MFACEDNDDDSLTLSKEALIALQEFYVEEELKVCDDLAGTKDVVSMPSENWQLSQFWYNDDTRDLLIKEALCAVGEHGRIAFVSCPSIFLKLQEISPSHAVRSRCFEYDQRFELLFGDCFAFYDYNEPLNLTAELSGSFDLVILDPPFLSEECLEKCSQTVRFLAKEKIILCTGSVMGEVAFKLLQVKKCSFIPRHSNNLSNEFCCYTNYNSYHLDT